MNPVQFSESVSVANVRDYGLNRFVSVCDHYAGRRVREAISFGKVLDSVAFSDSLYCYLDSTRKRFRSTVFYEPAYRPKGFSETYYVLPRHTSVVCESTREHHPNKVTRRWYSTSLLFDPKEFGTGIPVIDADDVFASPGEIPPIRTAGGKTGSRDKETVPNGRHLSTVQVDVVPMSSVPAGDVVTKTTDRNNNVMADNSYTIRYRSGDVTVTPDDQVVYRSAVKVVGNPA